MTSGAMLELAAAAALLVAGIWLYRRRATDGSSYGSQGAVLLFVVAVILAIHALGLMEYRPSEAEIEAMQS